MALVKAQISIATQSGVLNDRPQNVLYFDATTPAGQATEIFNAIVAMYVAMGNLFPISVDQTGHSVRMYDMSTPAPRVPFFEDTFVLDDPSPTGQSLPPEVALCISFQASRQAGAPQARRRGRIFIGPISQTHNEAAGRPTLAVRAQLAGAASILLEASGAASDWSWVVFSPTGGTFAVVDNGWVDNAWDTQRRRGIEASERTVFTG